MGWESGTNGYAIWDNLTEGEQSGGRKILKWILNEYNQGE
jgi:hypothetical protein